MNTRDLKKHLKFKIPQLKLALLREPHRGSLPVIVGPEDIYPYLEPLKYLSEEHFIALHLNAKLQIIGYHVVSHGILTASLVHPREVYKAALLSNAYAIVVAHNHPSGGSVASDDDIETTKKLIAAGDVMGVKLFDHLIVTYREITSIRSEQPEMFESRLASDGLLASR